MTEENTGNLEANDGTMCDRCGQKYPGDYPRNGDSSKIQRAIQKEKASKILTVLGLLALMEGFLCLVAAYLDQTWGVLPTDPLSILGVASILAGCLLTVGSFLASSRSVNEKEDMKENSEICTDNKKDR